MQTRFASGSIADLDLPDLLLALQASCGTGRLRLEREGVARTLYLLSGHLAAADSSAGTDALDWLLFAAGVLSEERHAKVRSLIGSGMRPGPALVESGLPAPLLCEWTERRARFLAADVLAWGSGTYEFEEGTAPPAGSIVVRVRPAEVILEALRRGSPVCAAPRGLERGGRALERVPMEAAGLLLPHEAYVLSLLDGRSGVEEICGRSELGVTETRRVLQLLASAGLARPAGEAVEPLAETAAGAPVPLSDLPLPVDLPAGETTAEIRAVIRIYNDLYSFITADLIKEVGPIAEQLLDKHLREVRDRHAAVFSRIQATREGVLAEETLLRNANLIRDQNRRDVLVAALSDYLSAMVIAVRRILGADHEARVARRLREMRCTRI